MGDRLRYGRASVEHRHACGGLAGAPLRQCQARDRGRETARLLACESFAAAAGAAVGPGCIAGAQEWRAAAFARIEARGGCAPGGQSATIGTEVEAAVASIAVLLRPSPDSSRCAKGKLRSAASRIRRDALALASDVRRPDPAALSARLVKNATLFAAGFAAAEAGDDCSTVGDEVDAGAALAATAARLRATLLPVCGDGVRAGAEVCDVGDDAACPGACALDCTCPSSEACGNGIVEAPGEECDGSACSLLSPEEHECAPPGDPLECLCCASGSTPCFDLPTTVSTPCCGGQVCVVEPFPSPSQRGYCAEPCDSHADCPAGELCTPAGGCQSFPPCTEDADCPSIPPFDVHCTPVGACEACLPGVGCWGPIP